MKKIIFIFLCTYSFLALAHPVAFKDAIGVMTWNQSFLSDNWITYSFRHDAAIALRNMRFEVQEGQMKFTGPQLDYLVKRWNNSDSQANIYAYGSYGSMDFQRHSRSATLAGVEADAEDRKYFIMSKYEKMWSKVGPDFFHSEFRLGIAPYEAEINEWASWFMIQYQYHPMLTKKESITPLIRLFYKSVLFEAGVSTKSDWMMNFMFHF